MITEKDIEDMDPYAFEELVSKLWEAKGYDTKVRNKSGDRGVDVEAEKGGYKEIIQVKCYKKGNRIGSQSVREYATLYQQIPTANQVLIVTSSGFTNEAQQLANDLNVMAVDGDELLAELQEYDVDTSQSIFNKTSETASDSGGMSYSERKKKAQELSENSLGNISVSRVMKSGTGSTQFSGVSIKPPVEVFTIGRGELTIHPNPHQPNYILTNGSKGLSDIPAAGKSSMWITDQGIHWFVTKLKSSDTVIEAWRFCNSQAVTTIECRTGILKDRLIVKTLA